MFIIIATLLALQEASQKTADRLQAFFNPALNWIQRWLPLFYVPTLVVLPVAVQGIQGELPVLCHVVVPRCRCVLPYFPCFTPLLPAFLTAFLALLHASI